MPTPIEAKDTVFIEQMTWMEARDALAAGKTTVIIATGGVEQNGPYMESGAHQIILKALTDRIARKLENALVAPLISYPLRVTSTLPPVTCNTPQHSAYQKTRSGQYSLTPPTAYASMDMKI